MLALCILLVLTLLWDPVMGRPPRHKEDAGRDFYAILELKKNAKAADIKKSYRKLTLQYHPDRNAGDEDAKKKFHDVADAYEVLSDADKRRKYDRCGEKCVNEPEQQNNDPFGGLFGGIFGQQ